MRERHRVSDTFKCGSSSAVDLARVPSSVQEFQRVCESASKHATVLSVQECQPACKSFIEDARVPTCILESVQQNVPACKKEPVRSQTLLHTFESSFTLLYFLAFLSSFFLHLFTHRCSHSIQTHTLLGAHSVFTRLCTPASLHTL